PLLALEVQRRQRAVRADPLEHAPRNARVLVERLLRPDRASAKPDDLARGHEREALVVCLEDLAALVEPGAPARGVVRDARVQEEVVVAPGDRERVELDRAEPRQDLEDGARAALERPRRREEVPRDEKPARSLSARPHREDASAPTCPTAREQQSRYGSAADRRAARAGFGAAAS